MNNTVQTYFSLEGKRALVTGAGVGIGRAMAEALAGAGAQVLIHYHRSKDGAEEAVKTIEDQGGTAWSAQCDLTKSQETKGLLDKVGQRWDGLDILINNAGDLVKRATLEQLDDELIDRVVHVNLHTTLYTTRQALPLLRRGQGSAIVNVGSIAGHNGGNAGAALYGATKGAIHTLTRGFAKELAPQIRVNGIAPGVAMTDFHRRHTTEEGLKIAVANTPLKRLGEAEDHGAACVFLCGPGASFITGETIEVNGGLWVK